MMGDNEEPWLECSVITAISMSPGGNQLLCQTYTVRCQGPWVHTALRLTRSCSKKDEEKTLYLFFFRFYFFIFNFTLLYNAVLVLPYINMNPPRVYYPKQSTNSMQSLSSYQWNFSQSQDTLPFAKKNIPKKQKLQISSRSSNQVKEAIISI